METPTSFGHWIRGRRNALALTQAELARRVGCAIVTLQQIEVGERRRSHKIAERLANCLALPLEQHAAFVRAAQAGLVVEQPADPTYTAVSQQAKLPELGRLPAQATAFIGRDRERMLVRVLLRRTEVRLLTLSGPGGTGKTRLALQAAELSADFADGVAFVGLASIGDPALVIPTIAKTLGVSDAGEQPLIVRLGGALQSRQLLLLLDNFEHVLPALGQPRQYDAVQLFVTRAQAASPDFALTDENAAAVADICRRLDGALMSSASGWITSASPSPAARISIARCRSSISATCPMARSRIWGEISGCMSWRCATRTTFSLSIRQRTARTQVEYYSSRGLGPRATNVPGRAGEDCKAPERLV